MRIAQVAPLAESIPPKGYGGTERVIANIESGLVDQGHDVTVFATEDSKVKGQLIPCRNKPFRMEEDIASDVADSMFLADTLRMLDMVHEMSDEFDIIHCHTDLLQMAVFSDIPEKTLTTLHWRLDVKGFPRFYNRHKNFPLVSITNAQRKPLPKANFVKTIYHGIQPPSGVMIPDGQQSYVAFLGRFSPEKGADRAINMARKAGEPIKLAAKICNQFEENKVYYRDVVQPMLNQSGVEYVGEINETQKGGFLSGAHALLMPINWPEPFGLVMIEAMACGTPVIATRYGSVPEVIEHGVTGFIVDNEQEAVEAIAKARDLDRNLIRQRFQERFSVEAMVLGYESLYSELAAKADTSKIPADYYTGKISAKSGSKSSVTPLSNRRLVS